MSRIVKSKAKTLPPGEHQAKVTAVVQKGDSIEIRTQVDAPGKPILSHFIRRAPARRGR